MEWQDDGIILSVNAQGEHAGIVNLFTPQQGKWAGRVSGAQSAKKRSWLVPGNGVQARWAARLEEQLGNFQLELTDNRTAHIFDAPPRLLALSYLAQLTDQCLSERLPLPLLYFAFEAACNAIINAANTPSLQPLSREGREASAAGLEGFPSPLAGEGRKEEGNKAIKSILIAYERALLDALGYGLDLSSCAVTGQKHDLTHISPNTGRAVCRAEAEPYGERLLPLPGYWLNGAAPGAVELTDAARVTGYFLMQHFYPPPRTLPVIRGQVL